MQSYDDGDHDDGDRDSVESGRESISLPSLEVGTDSSSVRHHCAT